MPQLLLELFSEEIPARMQAGGAAALREQVCAALKAASLKFDEASDFSTPRRIVVVVDGLPEAQPDIAEERRGPRTDAPEKAFEGFLRANTLTRNDCERRTVDKGEFWFAVIQKKGQATEKVLSDILPEAIRKLSWQKSMRWGSGSLRWVRPLKSVLCLLDGVLVPIELGCGVPCTAQTQGHRFYGTKPFEVGFFGDYEKSLQRAKVILNPETRRKVIVERAEALLEGEGLSLVKDQGLLSEVVGLVEWPVPLLGAIDPEFMELPDEVLTTSMRSHQKYFSVKNEEGMLAPHFVVVANIDAEDGGKAIVAGNERVLRARLSDAKFFWDLDRRSPLESFLPQLDGMRFHVKLGTITDKARRLEALAGGIAALLGADESKARRAAALCKADLVTGMVGEFASLQGIMGSYYADACGELEDVSLAIAEHYSPAGPNDKCPSSALSVAVAIADKLDTLVGFFGIGEKPTGSRDPYGLRRAALGIIRMILENQIRMSLSEIIFLAREEYRAAHPDDPEARDAFERPRDSEATKDLVSFFADRLKVHLRAQGVRHDLIDAVFALVGEDDISRIIARVEALQEFLGAEDGQNLLAGFRRATNIVEIEEKKDGISFEGRVDNNLLDEAAEKNLAEALSAAATKVTNSLAGEDFSGAMGCMAALREPVDLFFDQVTVNAENMDVRRNRLSLLAQFRSILGQVADFGRIEG